ncbi:hypothetical protein thsrh120_36300 [Rhizobium sp. No.120]
MGTTGGTRAGAAIGVGTGAVVAQPASAAVAEIDPSMKARRERVFSVLIERIPVLTNPAH